MKYLTIFLLAIISLSLVGCGYSDVVSGSVMKRKYRKGIYIAKRSTGNSHKDKSRLLKSDLRQAKLAVQEPAIKMDKVAGVSKIEGTEFITFHEDYVAPPNARPRPIQNKVYWLEDTEDDSPLNNRVLEIILGVLCFFAAIAAFVGLIFGVTELVKVVAGTSTSSMSVAIALAILAFGLPIAIAVVWTLVALGVKLIKGE